MLKLKALGALLPLTAGLLVAAMVAEPAGATHSWGTYHWARTANTFTLKLGNNLSGPWPSHLDTTSSDWSASTVLKTTIVTGGTNPKNCRPTAGRVEVCSSRYGNNGWLGLAQIWISGGEHITQGAVKVNDYYFNSPPYNTSAWRNLVMCQEVGHTFGLDHQDEQFDNANLGSCMDYTNNPLGPPSNEHPNKHDYDMLASIYAHTNDGTTTVAASTGQQAAAAGAGNSQAEWGRAVRYSSDGRPIVFEQDLGNGRRIFTFVIWAG